MQHIESRGVNPVVGYSIKQQGAGKTDKHTLVISRSVRDNELSGRHRDTIGGARETVRRATSKSWQWSSLGFAFTDWHDAIIWGV